MHLLVSEQCIDSTMHGATIKSNTLVSELTEKVSILFA